MFKYYVTYRKPGADASPNSEKICDTKEELLAFLKSADEKAAAIMSFEEAVSRPRSGYQPQYEILRIIEGEEKIFIPRSEWVEVLIPKQIIKKDWIIE